VAGKTNTCRYKKIALPNNASGTSQFFGWRSVDFGVEARSAISV
jgi:hypothetical protein